MECSPMFEHQRKGVEFALANNGTCALFWDMGVGKCRTAIEIFKALRVKTPHLKMFVVCPLTLIKAAWGEDVAKFSDFTICSLRGLDVKELKNINADIYICNYEYLIGTRMEELIKSGFFMRNQLMCVADESSRFKTYNAQTTQVLLKLRQVFKHKLILSGTPAPNIEWEYWPQITFLKDNVFHPKFHAFKNVYFLLKRGDQVMQGNVISRMDAREIYSKGWKYFIPEKNRQALLERIKPFCSFLKKEDCLDLPEKFDINREYILSQEQYDSYQQMEEDLVAEINGNFVSVTIALAKIMKLRQVGSGFMMDENSHPITFKENPKKKLLEEILEEIGTKQVIIWIQFKEEVHHLHELLGAKMCTIYSDTPDKDLSIHKFRNGDCQYLVAHPASAGHGLTFINCSYEIFYSIDYSWERYAQARDRIYRIGQKNQCTYIHLLGMETIDHDILKVLQRKADANDLVHDFIKKQVDKINNKRIDHATISNQQPRQAYP